MKRPELAKRAKLSYPYVSEIENGQKEPSSKALRQLAEALQLSLTELMMLAERIPEDAATLSDKHEDRIELAVPSYEHSPSDAMEATYEPREGMFERSLQDFVARAVHAELARWSKSDLIEIIRREVKAARRTAKDQ
jgi:transcriptional regulator with XRE-family HTH domain